MADTPQAQAQLLSESADNTTGNWTNQDERNFILSAVKNGAVLTSSISSITMSTNYLVVDKPSGSPTLVALPTSQVQFIGEYTVKDGKGDAATNPITIVTPSGLIDGEPSFVINTPFGAATFFFDGTNYWSKPTPKFTQRAVNIVDYGAVADAALTNNVWGGTDNAAFIANALGVALILGSPLYIPTGKYYSFTNPLDMSGLSSLLSGLTIIGDGKDASTLIYLDKGQACIATPFQTTFRMPYLVLKDFGLIGPGAQLLTQGSTNAIALQCVDKVTITGVAIDYSAVMNISGRHSKDVLIGDCRFTHSFRDGVNFDASFIRVIGNQFNHIGDDSIACTSMTGNAGDFPARDGIAVVGNTINDGGGITCISARGCVVTGNTTQRGKGRFIAIGNSTGSEGATPAHGVTITGNTCRDLISYNATLPYFINLASTFTRLGTASGQVTPAIPGTPNTATGEMVSPYPYLNNNSSDTTVPMPPGYAFNVVGNTCAMTLPFVNIPSLTPTANGAVTTGSSTITLSSGAGVVNGMTVCGGNIAQGTTGTISGTTLTLSAPTVGPIKNGSTITITDATVPLFSAQGYGLIYTSLGWTDIPLTVTVARSTQAFLFSKESTSGIIQGVNLVGNLVSGVGYGLYINAGVQVLDMRLSANQWRDISGEGIATIAATAAFNRITIDGDVWDGDPYFQGTNRNVTGTAADGANEYDGSWTTTVSSTPIFCLTAAPGLTVKNCEFRNWAVMYPARPTGSVWENNTIHCNPAAVGFSASNKGIATVIAPVGDFKYKIEDMNPASTTYGQLLNDCPAFATAVPSSGTWVAGTIVVNSASVGALKTTAGNQTVPIQWMRITTGANNVLGTDWLPVFSEPSPTPRVVTVGALTITATDHIVIANKASGSATACNLISSPVTGMQLIIKDGKGDASTNNITITPAAGTIDGSATLVINTNYGVARIFYSGTEWNTM